MSRKKSKARELCFFLFLPFILAPLEAQYGNPSEIHRVSNFIKIDAPPETVWKEITSVDSIKKKELPWSFSHLVGLPEPVRSEMVNEKDGKVRNVEWEKGVRFKERILISEPPHRLTYEVEAYSIPRSAIDPHVRVNGEHFSALKGGYVLTGEDENTTRLRLYCDYRIATRFNFYSRFWADLLIEDLHQVILPVIKKRAEESV